MAALDFGKDVVKKVRSIGVEGKDDTTVHAISNQARRFDDEMAEGARIVSIRKRGGVTLNHTEVNDQTLGF